MQEVSVNTMTQKLKFNKQFLRDFWRLLTPYWKSEEKKSAWSLLMLNFLCVFGEVGAGVGFNHFHKIFFDALQAFNHHAILYSIYFFLLVRTLLLVSLAGSVYFTGILSVRWRRWLTKNYIHQWLDQQNHYRMQIENKHVDNPDQRISEDLENFASQTLKLFFGPYMVLQSFLYFVSFGYILWEISNKFIFHVGGNSFLIPGYLCWIAIIYSVVGISIITIIGKKLSSYDYKQQRLNADFRFGLIRFRESSEQVSLYRGEKTELGYFNQLFSKIFDNFLNIVSLKTRVTVFERFYTVLSYILSFAISIPFYVSKTFQLGTVMQIQSAYASVVDACSIFLSSFAEFAEWRAVIHRLTEFKYSMNRIQNENQIKFKNNDQQVIIIKNLQLKLPCGKNLLNPINIEIKKGDKILIKGSSGSGKSVLLRALSGIWTYGDGEINVPSSEKTLFIPQKPYLPIGTFKELISYPGKYYDENEINDVLKTCNLEKFTSQLNEIKNWSQELSLGEQQLISFARVFLFKPELLFLDEVTSNLDVTAEENLYTSLHEYFPDITLVSVAHRENLRKFHDVVFNFKSNSNEFRYEEKQGRNVAII